MPELIIDTNVPIAARGDSSMSEVCSQACAELLDQILNDHYTVVIDDAYFILNEYENRMKSDGAPNYANRFLKWVLTNQVNLHRVKQVQINHIGHGDFEEFPEELREIGFDPSDRKFVAVAIANKGVSPIIQATDSKWIGWNQTLAEQNVKVIFPCETELREIHIRKQRNN